MVCSPKVKVSGKQVSGASLLAIGVFALAAMVGPGLAIGDYGSDGRYYDYKVRASTDISLGFLPDGSLKARVVYDSKEPACITPDKIKFRKRDPSPEIYYFELPGSLEGGHTQFHLPLVAPHTYEQVFPPSTQVDSLFYNKETTHRELRWGPISEIESAHFLTRIRTSYVKVTKHGKEYTVKCAGAPDGKVFRF